MPYSSKPTKRRLLMAKTSVLAVLAFTNIVALAQDQAAMQRCRVVQDSAERLKCYDAIPLKPSAAEDDRTISSVGGTTRDGAGHAADTSKEQAAKFGLPVQSKPLAEPNSIASSIAGRFLGWQRNSRILLSNGQVWEIRDGSEAAYDLFDPKVRIVRGLSGTFFMEVEGVSQTPRVRRIE